MNAKAIQAQEVAAAYKRGLEDQRRALAAELQEDIYYARLGGMRAARKRARVLILIASLFSFGVGAWFF